MVHSFLRLFAQFRQVEAEAAALREDQMRLATEKLLLQDRLDAVREDRSKLWDLMQECLRGERTAYQMHVNQAWQRQGGGIPYPDAPHLPPSAVPKEANGEAGGRRGRALPSEMVAQKTQEYIQSLIGK